MMIISLMLVQGCAFEENLPHVDLTGTVKIPKVADTFRLGTEDEDGDGVAGRVVSDPRALGPIYIGAFPSVQEGLYSYPHPEIGPIVGNDGDTYPYGGNSVGRFDWACYQALICKVVTGRFTDYADIIDFFDNVIEEPIRTIDGQLVTTSTEFQERCFEVEYATGDFEMLFIGDLDLTDNGEYYEADVELPHVFFKEGMQVWGWLDMPDEFYDFSTCSSALGDTVNYYNEFYDLGTNPLDLLNFPGQYIESGDWIVSEAPQINSPDDSFELEIDFQFLEDGDLPAASR